jgi:hypothetical protein
MCALLQLLDIHPVLPLAPSLDTFLQSALVSALLVPAKGVTLIQSPLPSLTGPSMLLTRGCLCPSDAAVIHPLIFPRAAVSLAHILIHFHLNHDFKMAKIMYLLI